MAPAVGRFTSADPFEGNFLSPISLHRYLYANVSPVVMSDPSGRFGAASYQVLRATIEISTILAVQWEPIIIPKYKHIWRCGRKLEDWLYGLFYPAIEHCYVKFVEGDARGFYPWDIDGDGKDDYWKVSLEDEGLYKPSDKHCDDKLVSERFYNCLDKKMKLGTLGEKVSIAISNNCCTNLDRVWNECLSPK
jgi:hypothetical protein